ncbi:hypothetical protein [Hydrogenophaga sp.]|jgi:hypothetical protein|uniref:hypothetical protein n=1 Tax=Hydrogenophaga sp. TaxID=1904254 RepID=UPI003F6F6B78
MNAWLLLLVTLGCAYLTYDAFRWIGSIERTPFSAISSLWKGGLTHLSVVEQNRLKHQYASKLFGAGQLCWLFLTITVVLGIFTIRAFIA